MKPRGIEIWKWLALRTIGRPSRPRFGLLGQIKTEKQEKMLGLKFRVRYSKGKL